MELLLAIGVETLRTLYLAAPFLLLGLVVAGFLHVLLPTATIQRFLGRPGMGGVTWAAAIGVPLPVCSCGVVPITVEMRRKGASQPASLSFLTTTPESSIDSILFTWGLMGPVMAIARPIAAFFTAVLGGALAIAYLPEDEPDPEVPEGHCGCEPVGPTDGDEHDHEHKHEHGSTPESLAVLRAWWRARRGQGGDGDGSSGPGLWRGVVKPALRYGFGELLDDLAFWLILGVLLAGVLGALVPADLEERGLGVGIFPMLLLLAVGVPLYMCASASTPIAAALLAKGVSPGAALVFLLAGPATNAATVVLLAKTFGRRFVQIYLVSVVAGALGAGLALDFLVARLGLEIMAPILETGTSAFAPIEWASLVILVVLLALSLWRGSGRTGWNELRESFGRLLPSAPIARRRAVLGAGLAGLVLAVLIWAATGLTTVPPGSHGYGFLFGQLVRPDMPPGGPYFLPPEPFGRWEIRRTGYPRKSDIGFRTDLELLAMRRKLAQAADPDEWHSPVAAMNVKPRQASFLTADENLVDLSFTVHYGLSDPSAFFYGLDHENDVVGLYAEAAAREYLAGHLLENLLTVGRQKIEVAVETGLAERLARIDAGVRVIAVRIVDIHPPSGAVYAFRDVSSAREDRETRIHRARETGARELPRARAEGTRIRTAAEATASAAHHEAEGRAEAFSAEASSIDAARDILLHFLWLESAERALAGREKYIVPGDTPGGRVTLWQNPPGTN